MPRRPEDKEAAVSIAKRIGRRGRTARMRLDLTQEALAESVAITAEALGRIERGTALPSFPTFLRLCSALKVSPNDLLADGGVPAAKAELPTSRRPREVHEIARYVSALDRRRQRLILGLARELARLTRS